MAKKEQEEPRVREINISPGDSLDTLNDSSLSLVKRITNLILGESIRNRASDLYMKKTREGATWDFKVDGRRHDMLPPPSYLCDGIADEIKRLVYSKDKTATRIIVCESGKQDNLEAYVSFANISESSFHLKFLYD